MSASNWAVCPRCLQRAKEGQAAIAAVAAAAYGKEPPEEWRDLSHRASEPIDEEKFRTFREDYEQGLSELRSGTYFVYYGGSCDRCGLEHSFRHEDQVWP